MPKKKNMWHQNHLPVEKRYIDERENLGNELTDEKGRYLHANCLGQNRREKNSTINAVHRSFSASTSYQHIKYLLVPTYR